MLKIISIITTFLIIIQTNVFAISAHSAIVVDAENFRVLYEKNAHQKRGIASTTKIMTAIVALESDKMNDMVKVSNNAASTEGSSMYLKPNENISMENLVYGLMLNSGNDAATAIAEHIGGSVEKFAILMNEKAKEIGMLNSSFANPHGLDNENHYSTAYDMAKLSAYAMKNEKFREIVSTKSKNIQIEETQNFHYLTNHNRLLNMYEYCNGIKTGFTKKCGRCLVSSAEKDGVKLITITLNAPDDWNDHISLYESVFDTYKRYKIIGKNNYAASAYVVDNKEAIKLYTSDEIHLTLTEDEYKKIKIKYNYDDKIHLPVYKEQILGKLEVIYNDKVLATTNLITQYGIEKNITSNFKDKLLYLFTDLFSVFFKSI